MLEIPLCGRTFFEYLRLLNYYYQIKMYFDFYIFWSKAKYFVFRDSSLIFCWSSYQNSLQPPHSSKEKKIRFTFAEKENSIFIFYFSFFVTTKRIEPYVFELFKYWVKKLIPNYRSKLLCCFLLTFSARFIHIFSHR
jgi:hypothetical protein